MRLLSLNVWGGSQGQLLLDFIKQNAEITDIFCFQEVFNFPSALNPEQFNGRANLYGELRGLLPGHTGYFKMTSKNHDTKKPVDFAVESGQAVFIKNNLKVTASEAIDLYTGKGLLVNPVLENPPTALQRVEISLGDQTLQVYNFHGITYPGEKLDSQERLEQSEKILNSLAKTQGEKILCGDFNLMPDTKSINMLGAAMNNLIKEYKITNTRNKISWGIYKNVQYFADFTFVSPGIKVVGFKVPYNEVSDHLPMILQFEI